MENVAGFRPIPEFPSLSRRYRASELFPTFRNRVMNSNRIDRGTYLNHLGLKDYMQREQLMSFIHTREYF